MLAPERNVDDETSGAVDGDRIPGSGLAADERQADRPELRRDDRRPEPPHHLLAEAQLASGGRRLAQAQAEQAAVGLAAVVEARNGLLADVAALGERHGALVEARLLGDHAVIQVEPVARPAPLD